MADIFTLHRYLPILQSRAQVAERPGRHEELICCGFGEQQPASRTFHGAVKERGGGYHDEVERLRNDFLCDLDDL